MADDERRAVAEALNAHLSGSGDWSKATPAMAEVAIAALDRVRDARGDDEAARWREKFEIAQQSARAWQSSYDGLAARLLQAGITRSPQGEDHKRRCGRMPWIRGGCALEYGHEGDHVFPVPFPQDEDHEALRAAAKRVLEADMRGEHDLDALNALEDAAGFTQQGQRRPEQPPPDRLGGQPPAEPPEAP